MIYKYRTTNKNLCKDIEGKYFQEKNKQRPKV